MSSVLDFCPPLADLYSRQGPGSLSTVNNLLAIRRLMLAGKPVRTLEVGMAEGASALTIAATHRDLGAAPARQHVAIDPYAVQVWKGRAMERLASDGLDGYVTWKGAFSHFALPELLRDEEGTFGLIYIDGSHEYEDVFIDFYYCRQLVAPGGYLLFDDSSMPDVRRVVRHVRRLSAFRFISMSQYRDLAGIDGVRRRLAQAAGRAQLTVFQRIV
jgi:predicted O-methyltransferase YrrM